MTSLSDASLTDKEKIMELDQSSDSDADDVSQAAKKSYELSPADAEAGRMESPSKEPIQSREKRPEQPEPSAPEPIGSNDPLGGTEQELEAAARPNNEPGKIQGLDLNANVEKRESKQDGTGTRRKQDPQSRDSKKNQTSGGSPLTKDKQIEKQQNPDSRKPSESCDTKNKKDHVPPSKTNLNEEPQTSSQRMVFGPPAAIEQKKDGDPEAALKQQQQAPHTQTRSASDKHSEGDAPANQHEAPSKRIQPSTQHITSRQRLTIYFHAILSKDFSFKENEDRIFIHAGPPIDDWSNDLLELNVSRDLESHGFFIEGKMVCNRKDAEAVSIPYKYVVYRAKKNKYEYELIYKMDSKEATNRCLFVKRALLNEEGEWHQYDDIICAEPSKTQIIKEYIHLSERKNVIQGKEIAGNVMLSTIFDLLRNWSQINLRSFLIQLRQFYEVYANPFVYEEKEKRWSSLDYGEKQVKHLLKQFMLERVVPELQKDSPREGEFIQEPLKAALIMLHVQSQYHLQLDYGTQGRLCSALCLPRLPKEEFLPFWSELAECFSLASGGTDSDCSRGTQSTMGPCTSSPAPSERHSQTIRASAEQDQPSILAMLNLMKKHEHLMEVDRLLTRSWMFLMTVDELKECLSFFRVDLLDFLQIFLMKCPEDIEYSSFERVSEILEHCQMGLVEERFSCLSEDHGVQCVQAACKLLEKICRAVSRKSFIQIPVTCMNLVATVSRFPQTSQETGRFSDKTLDLLNEAKKTVRAWTRKMFKSALLTSRLLSATSFTDEIETWNNILAIEFKSKDFTEEWREILARDFEGKFLQEDQMDQIEVYCSKIEELKASHPFLAGIVEKCALQAVTAICQLVSTIILKSWPRDEQGEAVLKHLLSWTAAKNIFQLHGADEKLINQLSNEAKEKFVMATSLFADVLNQLITGKIKMRLLHLIMEKKGAFLELLSLDCFSENEPYKDMNTMKALLQRREEEMKAIRHEKALVDALITMCHSLEEHVKVNVKDLEEKHCVDIDEMQLDTFLDVQSTQMGALTYFNLEEDVWSMAEILETYKESYIFKCCWLKQAEDGSDSESEKQPITLEDLYGDIFEPCYKNYKNIYTTLKNGSITFKVVDESFKGYKGKYEELAAEVAIMCKLDSEDDRLWVRTRIQQMEQYHELHLAAESAQVVSMVKQTLHLQGDFETSVEFKDERLDSIDNELVQAKAVLVDITEARRLCLQELGLRKTFVMWVKEALEDINELKVFVDLASISAGENDLDVDRVACFHDAVLGYSPLLYDLKPDASFGIFKEMLKKLWKALDNDPNLPKKVRDSARHLEWLKTVKDSHGSVELSSLSLASAINSHGIYVIRAEHHKKLCLGNVLKLHILEEIDGECEKRVYSLEDLRDLQNKLMLMSGKGDQGQREVDQFAEVFASVQRLASAFIDLFLAGNPLFRQWEANINCKSSDACIVLDFNLSSIDSVVMVEGDVTRLLPEVCKKMESCLSFWKTFMNKQRSQHYYLNYYTAEQVVYLCSQLSPSNLNQVEPQALTMLSFLKPRCSLDDLRHAYNRLQYGVNKSGPERREGWDSQIFEDGGVDGGLCTEDEASQLEKVDCSKKLDVIWNSFMRNMNTILPDSLDVPSFGCLLNILAKRPSEGEHASAGYIQRQLPNNMAAGRPNLIICAPEEILISCIALYMCSKDEPLPTYDEVLLCTASTPYEEVELLLRRCLSVGYDGTKIYTMLYVDKLSYEVSYSVEKFFQRHSAQGRNDYRLVLICGSNREHAYLPSAFSQFRLLVTPLHPLASVQCYLAKHFTVASDVSSAAAVFKNRQHVGVVWSKRSGVGKSLYVKRMHEELKSIAEKPPLLQCIRLIEPRVDEDLILRSLISIPKTRGLSICHFDVTTLVKKGLDEFLFRLLVLGYLKDSEGKMWKSTNESMYVIEVLRPDSNQDDRRADKKSNAFLDVFPSVYCRPPKDVLEVEMRMQEDPSVDPAADPLMDDQEFRSEAFQRPYQYLQRFHNRVSVDDFVYRGVEGTHVECLQMLFVYCGISDPSWAELRNFTWFLNLQLRDCEQSVFCDVLFIGDTLVGFRNFVVEFMILMAKDFATPSLSISDQSPGRLHNDLSSVNEEDLAPFKIRKRWESEPHPYIFFNDDHESMTFIGFHLQPNDQNGIDAIDPSTNRVIKQNVMTVALYEGLKLQRVPFNINFDELPRWEKIERLSRVLGIQWPVDPDETYELTTDNMLKMLAIHMRFRCGIPVIIMGETGCGKTRLIKFLCEMHRSGVATDNMKLVKVHGGTSSDMVYSKVKEAEDIALRNKLDYGFHTVLFFDEANTTEAISSIKEILCDNTADGHVLSGDTGLRIIAACNPYRKHTDVMITRLEAAGLGYRVRAEETDEKLGSIPLRQLVYRVQALPPSMIPLVWDFGQLNDHTEKIYIKQIIERVAETHSIDSQYTPVITDVLSASQKYMRTRQDECSFVSLRDVERCMQVFAWFYQRHEILLRELKQFEQVNQRSSDERNPILWSLLMAVGVCYHSCLEQKERYRSQICDRLPHAYSPAHVMQEISVVQDLFLNGIPLGETIARNNALKENVFMMVICIELRIPLFLVGKPGSSKSLSKTLVADGMQGQAAHSDLFRKLKQIHLVSFQCSPHSTPDGIISTFKQCARFQEGKNLTEYVSVVVLDEIGLAEDSQKMPLKTLHPLLEEGCIDDLPAAHKKVGFIGISNWALDPAKMNRGIFVSRGDPDEKELIESAKGICASDAMVLEKVRDCFKPFACAYLQICKEQGKDFFGLRDYYSLVKMIFAIAKAHHQKPSAEQIVKSVLRNFSGMDNLDSVRVFTSRLSFKPKLETISSIELIRENITALGQDEECRYLLVLTKNYAALGILQQTFFSDRYQPEIIFGSSFPKDQEYTQICRNINRVKICMETGQTIVLLNLQNLYESLYDALNQYYVTLGGQKYVDLGLGTHRVKCRVHKDFRLIVIEEKDIVYKQFPIPLINRLEKHYLDLNTVLKTEQKGIVKKLETWVKDFIHFRKHNPIVSRSRVYSPADVFIGYHSDTCASVVLQVTEQLKAQDLSDPCKGILEEAKLVLLNCATPDAVVRLDCTSLSNVEIEFLSKVYFEDQEHSSLSDFILMHTQQEGLGHACFTEVTTFSRLLTAAETKQLQCVVPHIELLFLQQFDTEQSFLKKIRTYLENSLGDKILIIQTDFEEGSQQLNVIASAKYSSINEISKFKNEAQGRIFVYFITKLPRMDGGTSYTGFNGGPWKSVHIDDLRRSKDMVSDVKALQAMEDEDIYSEEGVERMELDDTNGQEEVLDTTTLVRSCVQGAVGMLRDLTQAGARSTKRVEILLRLLADKEPLQAAFLKAFKKRLHSLLKDHDDISSKSWVSKEALDIDSLHEGGTFRHALWRRVQAVVTPFLAQLISIMDRDCNLDLLLDRNSEESLKKLWLDLFSDLKILTVPYSRNQNNSVTETILVQKHMDWDKGCAMPFSWRIKDLLEELWKHCLLREDHSVERYEELFWKTPLGRYISEASREMQGEFFHRYLQDFISMSMTVASDVDLKVLHAALTCSILELRRNHRDPRNQEISLVWVHAGYRRFKIRIQNLHRMICIEPQLSQRLLESTVATEGEELVLDVFAALACIEYLEPPVEGEDDEYLAWFRRVKTLQVPIELVCSEESAQQYGERSKQRVNQIKHGWRRIYSLALFIEHMLLGVGEVELTLRPLVLRRTRHLAQVLEKDSELREKKAFEEVITVLKACKDEASWNIFRFGAQQCAVCMGDPQEPLSLPCDHIYCLACIRQCLENGQNFCPQCMKVIPVDFKLAASETIRRLTETNASFRTRCNAFFIDLVSSVCFKDNTPPSGGVILHLLSLLMVEASAMPHGRESRFLTKALSPFDDCVDKNPVVRSVVLKLLLKYSFDDVKDYLQMHLTDVEQSNILEETDKTELYCLYINCLEDSMYDRTQWHSVAEQQACLQEEALFLLHFLPSDSTSIEHLQQVARVRLGLDMAADLLANPSTSSGPHEDSIQKFLDSVKHLCCQSGNDWHRVYLIRKICSIRGMEYVQKLLPQQEHIWLFPQEILHSNQDHSRMDHFLACGKSYKMLRDAIATALIDGNVRRVQQAIEDCDVTPMKKAVCLLLALFREVTALFRTENPKAEQCAVLEDFVRTSEVLVSDEMRAFAEALLKNALGVLSLRAEMSARELVLVELSVHLKAVLLCGNLEALQPLQQLGLSPNSMLASFIPTMPDDMLAVAQQAMGPLRWYLCPNGHPCTVGECGLPMMTARCLDCNVDIGGNNHNPVPGFTIMQQEGDRTQTGHILGNPQRRDHPDMQDTKNMSPAPFALLRILTHMSMLIGVHCNPQSIMQIIRPPVLDPASFLNAHLEKDVQQLSRALGKGEDDTVGTIHLAIHSLLDPHPASQYPPPFDTHLSTKDHRNGWEVSMSNDVMAHQLKDLERQLKEVNTFIREDERVSSNPVMKLTFGNPELFLRSLPKSSLIHNSSVWCCKRKVSVLSLTHIVEQNNGRDTLPVLWKFLQREPELRLVRFLPDILALQRDLVRKFQNITDLPYSTISEFLQDQKAASLNAWYEKRIRTFLSAWNQTRVSLKTAGEIRLPDHFTQDDLDLDADLQVLLPQRHGLGLYTVSPADLNELHVIRYEYNRELLPLVLSNCQYCMERGQETVMAYDLPKIQQQLFSRFLQGKPHITLNGIPTLVNRQERNFEIMFKDVKAKVPQEALLAVLQQELVKELQDYNNLCEALSTAELVLHFLAMTGGEPHMLMGTYLKEVLQMTDQMAPHVIKALSPCSLKNSVALWQLLSSVKSESMLRHKRDPFADISEDYKHPLQEEHKALLTSFFTNASADGFLLEMHEFLLLVLKNPKALDIFKPDWSLKDTMVAYMERKDVDVPPEVEELFPQQILLKHFTETWSFSVLLRQKRNQS
ncbi:hypothetical protein DNTS_016006 [Danionella cerebrum]|uniref:RING-type E3 ubiquitin transferase n=1 Tax=Danionella cerebrum TaxID=2873325 RepID=A0A553Q6F5_9TELE|nr:hypothetical protein DNTS_016006 [Danionella translucida]